MTEDIKERLKRMAVALDAKHSVTDEAAKQFYSDWQRIEDEIVKPVFAEFEESFSELRSRAIMEAKETDPGWTLEINSEAGIEEFSCSPDYKKREVRLRRSRKGRNSDSYLRADQVTRAKLADEVESFIRQFAGLG